MKNEISELLSGISKEEFEKFGDFIRSPYFNKLPRLIKLYDYIKKNFESAAKGNISRENISEFMYPGGRFKNESIRKLLSDFWKLLERFLTQEEFESKEWDKNIYLLRGLRTRHYDDNFFKRLKEFKSGHKNSVQEIDEFYETKTKLISEEYEYWYFSKFDENNEINQEKSDSLDYEFIVKKLFLFQYMLSREYVNKNLKYDYSFLGEIENHVRKNKKNVIKDNPEVYRNFLGAKFLLFNGDKNILKEMKTFLDVQEYYKRKISKPYWDFINLCVFFTNRGEVSYYSEIFFYLKLLHENNLILNNKELVHYYFKIAQHAAIYQKEFKWLEGFIEKYGERIKHSFKKDMINLAYSNLFFEQNLFSESKNCALKISFQDYILYLSAKCILIKISYEENNVDSFELIADSVKKYVQNKKDIPSIYMEGINEFINIVGRLFKIKEKSSFKVDARFEITVLKKELSDLKEKIAFSTWLQRKLDVIIK